VQQSDAAAVLCCAVLCCVLYALQVLSNPELRAKYDKYGSSGLDVEFADASMIFGMLFGSELFEPIVGEFLIAAATSKGRELTEKEINHMQVRIEVQLVQWLVLWSCVVAAALGLAQRVIDCSAALLQHASHSSCLR
jgi:DnaJ-class molecular chaperone